MLFGANLYISIEPSQFHWHLFPTSYQLRLTMATPPTKDPVFVTQAAALAHSDLISSEKNVETLMSKISLADDADGSKTGLLLSIVELLFNSDKRALAALINADFDFSSVITGLCCWVARHSNKPLARTIGQCDLPES